MSCCDVGLGPRWHLVKCWVSGSFLIIPGTLTNFLKEIEELFQSSFQSFAWASRAGRKKDGSNTRSPVPLWGGWGVHVPRPQTLGISGCARRCLEPWKMSWQGWSPRCILIPSTQPWSWPEGLEKTGGLLNVTRWNGYVDLAQPFLIWLGCRASAAQTEPFISLFPWFFP